MRKQSWKLLLDWGNQLLVDVAEITTPPQVRATAIRIFTIYVLICVSYEKKMHYGTFDR